jgi:Galactosyltransferase
VDAYPARLFERGFYMGYFHNDSVPDRDPKSKWYDAQYDAVAYPPYAAGPLYGVSRNVLEWLVRASEDGMLRTDWRNEDVSMGSWLHGTRFQRVHDEGMLRYLECSVRDHTKPPFALHIQTYLGGPDVFRRVQDAKERAAMLSAIRKQSFDHIKQSNILRGKCC